MAWDRVFPSERRALQREGGDWIVVSEFDNHTGEPVLDGTLRTAVEREFESATVRRTRTLSHRSRPRPSCSNR